MPELSYLLQHWYIFAFYAFASGLISAFIAQKKNRDQGNWFLIGLVAGIIAIVAAALAKRLPDERAPGNNLLIGKDHYLRAGWRFLGFVVMTLLLNAILVIIAQIARVVPNASILFLFYIAVLIATIVMTRFVDNRRFVSVGVPFHGAVLKETLLGFLLGAVMICLVGGFEMAVGAIKLSLRPNLSILLLARNFSLSFLFFGYFALGEELLFRGYAFQTLVEGMGAIAATILVSIIFGALHSSNPDATLFSTLNTMLAGVWLSVAYLKTRALYFPFGAHFAWNLVQSFFLSLPVSGLLTDRTIFIPTDYGPDWLTGGKYGPEAGACATVVVAAATIYLLIQKRIGPAYDFASSRNRIPKK